MIVEEDLTRNMEELDERIAIICSDGWELIGITLKRKIGKYELKFERVDQIEGSNR